MKTTIENNAQISERGIKNLIAKRGLQNVAEVIAVWNNWENCTTIDVRFEGRHQFDVRFHRSKTGKIKLHNFN